VRDNLTLIIILGTLLHVIVLAIMIWIRVRRTEPDGGAGRQVTPCVVCGEPSTHWGYDGLDPNQQVNSQTGQAWSADIAHYRPLCATH
jgi:membrane protein involved in colicin uptake